MTGPTARALAGAQFDEEALMTTRRGIAQRLRDPYMTEHDLWVLRQFARFLGGLAPEPDPRVVRSRTDRHLRRPN